MDTKLYDKRDQIGENSSYGNKQDIEAADDWLVKKMCLDSKPIFKKRGHLFNKQVRDKVDTAGTAFTSTPLPWRQPSPCCRKVSNLAIADRSKHEWVTAAEYEEDKLADKYE